MEETSRNKNLSTKNEENESPLIYPGMTSQDKWLSDKNKITHESQIIKSYEHHTNHKVHKSMIPDY